MTTTCPVRDDWMALLADELSMARREELARHLDECDACRQTLEDATGRISIPTTFQAPEGSATPGAALRSVISRLLANEAGDRVAADFGDGLPSGLLSPSNVPGALGRLGKYEVLSVVGRGGLGVVMRGLDPQLNRIVAIKIPAPELAASAAVRRRFLREAQAAAAVSHDHVVTIHAVDETQHIPYLVMEYITGTSLQHELDEHGPLDLKKVLRIGMQTASGLAAAHRQGLVHRDVKPANILLENGIQRVKLTDFGLARAVDDVSLTQSGVVAGTPQYMSPEQARGETVDARSDLFSLGAVLYAMCTGRPAFRGESTMSVLRRVCEDEPRPIAQINPDIPDWLVTIIDRLLTKHPADRIQTAQQVADLLSGHLAHLHEPSSIQRPRPLRPRRKLDLRQWKAVDHWATRAAALLLIVTAVGLPLTCATGYQSRWNAIGTAKSSTWEAPRPPAPPKPPEREVAQAAAGNGPRVFQLPNWAYSVQFSPDGHELLASTWGAGIQFINLDTGVTRPGPPLDSAFVNRAIYVRDNLIAATIKSPDLKSTEEGTFELLELGDPSHVQRFRAAARPVWQLSASANGQLIAAAGDDTRVLVWHVEEGLKATLDQQASVNTVAMSPDGSQVVGGGRDGVMRVWSLADQRETHKLTDLVASEAVFLNDNRHVLVAGGDYHAYLWDIPTDTLERTLAGHTSIVTSVAVSPDSTLAATGGDDKTVRLWDLKSGLQVSRLLGHTENVLRVAFSPDGRWLASASKDGTVRVWSVPLVETRPESENDR